MTRVWRHALAIGLAMALSFGLVDARTAPAARPSGEFTVVSLNLAMRDDVDRIVAEMREIGADTADVLILQEVAGDAGTSGIARRLGERLGLDVARRDTPQAIGGLAVLSRFALTDARVLALKRFNLTFRSRDRFALVVTVATPSGPLRVYNVHLDTRINPSDRLEQVSGVVDDLARSPEPAIVAGDFNTNSCLWLFHTIPLPVPGRQGANLEEFMTRHGLRSVFDEGPTHDALRMRLDWVFVKGLQTTTRSVHPVAVSDHHALVVSVRHSASSGTLPSDPR